MSLLPDISLLIERGLIADDAEVLSSHNNLVMLSRTEQTVARIALVSQMKNKEDPGDIIYSHRIAWEASRYASVLRPIDQEPLIADNIVVSKYPLLEEVDWQRQDAGKVHADIRLFNAALPAVHSKVALKELDIAMYAQLRINAAAAELVEDAGSIIPAVQDLLSMQHQKYPFQNLTQSDPGLVHGDLHSGNFVVDGTRGIKIIDLDSTSYGPRLYDLASWRFRAEMGDAAPVAKMIESGRNSPDWDEETYRILIGWKALSSMTHVLRHERQEVHRARVRQIGHKAVAAGALLEGVPDI